MPIDYENPSVSDIIVLQRRADIDELLRSEEWRKYLKDICAATLTQPKQRLRIN